MVEYVEQNRKAGITDEMVLDQLKDADPVKHMHPQGRSGSGIVVSGMDDMAVRFVKCCNPLPGDEIVGFVTRGRGVSIHRTDCVNILQLPEIERARLIEAEWAPEAVGAVNRKYIVEIAIYANNRSGLIADISKTMTDEKIDIISLNTKTSKQGVATLNISFEVSSREQLHKLVEKLKQIKNVIDVDRRVTG